MDAVERYYDSQVEREWAREARHRTEFAVTRRALAQYLPPPPARIADVGGGPGRYALWLAGRGYEVTLVDLSQANLEYARERAADAGVKLAGCVHADARDLRMLPEAEFDTVLLMGPLYHLIELEDRTRARDQARRIGKPGGWIFASFITRYAALRWAARNDPGLSGDSRAKHDELLARGYAASDREGQGFPNAYFARPAEVEPLMEAGGFETVALIGCEPLVSQNEEGVNALAGDLWEAWVEWNYRLGYEPTLRGAADHLLYVGRLKTS